MEDVSVFTRHIDYTFTHDDYMYVSIYITNFYLVCHQAKVELALLVLHS